MVVALVPPPPPPETQKVSATPPRRESVRPGKRQERSLSPPATPTEPEAEAIGGAVLSPPPVAGSGPPAGLGGLLAQDPCEKLSPRDRPAHCRTGWSDRVAAVPKALARRIEKSVDAQKAASVAMPDCGSVHLGCTPIPERTLIGTRPADRSMAPGGPTGTDGMVGRPRPPNAYHVDPGFGD
jgi:hypothetical protein